MTYPDAIRLAIRALRARSTRPVYAAVVIRTEYPGGIPEELQPLHRACLRGTWADVTKALAALPAEVRAA